MIDVFELEYQENTFLPNEKREQTGTASIIPRTEQPIHMFMERQ